MEALFYIAAALVAYTYLGYPLVLSLLARLSPQAHQIGEALPNVSIVVAAHQEAEVIQQKLDNFLELDYPADLLDMVVVSDGSTDGTDEIIQNFACSRIQFFRQEPRQGKASALAIAFGHTQSEILVLTDANVLFQPDAIHKLVRHFADPEVGAVTGVVTLVDDKAGYAESEGAYYRYERFLQEKESTYHSVVGVDGALYAARRELMKAPHPDTILDDFVISMELASQGHRILYDPEAHALEEAAPGMIDEYRRKVRVATGAFQSLAKNWGIPGFKMPRLLFCYLSHKVFRWLAPINLIIIYATNLWLANHSWVWAALLILQTVFYGSGLIALAYPPIRNYRGFSIPMYFVLMNGAFLQGLYRHLGSETKGHWAPTKRGQRNLTTDNARKPSQ